MSLLLLSMLLQSLAPLQDPVIPPSLQQQLMLNPPAQDPLSLPPRLPHL